VSGPKFSRASPSPRYRRLLEQYQSLHLNGEPHLGLSPERTYPGRSLPAQAPHIKRLIELTGARSILDYGSGKGHQYRPWRMQDTASGISYPDVKSFWGVAEIACYDPAYPPFIELPRRKFDGVVCTDVLEHCPEEDIPWILAELFGFAEKFVYGNVACFPARQRLPSGANAHCTIKSARWWEEALARAAAATPEIAYEFRVAYVKANQKKEKTISRP
jgi:hypothetical protein